MLFSYVCLCESRTCFNVFSFLRDITYNKHNVKMKKKRKTKTKTAHKHVSLLVSLSLSPFVLQIQIHANAHRHRDLLKPAANCVNCVNRNNKQANNQTSKQTNTHKKKVCKWNYITLVLIVGGLRKSPIKGIDSIYYALSDDLNYIIETKMDENVKNLMSIWVKSDVNLHMPLFDCKCVLTGTNTCDPILHIIGGTQMNRNLQMINKHYQIKLWKIIGVDNVRRLFMTFKTVKHTHKEYTQT